MNPQKPSTYLKRTFVFLGRLLALLITLVLCLPVILLPSATAVPTWGWIPLAAADLTLLVMFFRLKPAWKGTAVSVAGMLLVGVLAVVASQRFATTPPITDSQGEPLPGSIATLERGHAQRQPAVDLGARQGYQETCPALSGRRPRRQPTGNRRATP